MCIKLRRRWYKLVLNLNAVKVGGFFLEKYPHYWGEGYGLIGAKMSRFVGQKVKNNAHASQRYLPRGSQKSPY